MNPLGSLMCDAHISKLLFTGPELENLRWVEDKIFSLLYMCEELFTKFGRKGGSE